MLLPTLTEWGWLPIASLVVIASLSFTVPSLRLHRSLQVTDPESISSKTDRSCESVLYEHEVREELARLGRSLPPLLYHLLQAFMTWLTGKPYRGQTPLFKSSRLYELGAALVALFGSAAVSASIWQSSPVYLPLLLISWAVTVGSARKLLTCIVHRCVHYQFWGDWRDRWLGETISTLIMTQNFDGYRHDHVKVHHHVNSFATFEHDPDARFVLALGFCPGLTEPHAKN